MFKIPQSNKQFKQDNSSDRLGNVHITKNISFDEKGYISLAPKAQTITDSNTLTDLIESSSTHGISAIVFDGLNAQFMAIGTKNPYISTPEEPTTWSKDTATGFPNFNDQGTSDAVYWDIYGQIFAANGAATLRKGLSWTSYGFNAHSLCEFINLSALAFGYTHTVTLYNDSLVKINQLVIPDNFTITKMAWNKNKIAIATRNDEAKKAILFEWDGLTAEANVGYEVPSGHTIYSVVPYKDGFACITSDGELLYNNGGWQVLDRLPIYYKKNYVWNATPSSNLSRPVSINAMVADGDYIYIGLLGLVSSTGLVNEPRNLSDFPSGIWCYDPEVGLHHKYSISSTKQLKTNAIETTSVDVSTDVITVAGVTVPETGTPVFYYNKDSYGNTDLSTNSSAPLKHGKRYYTIKLTDSTLKLATTKSNALASTAINLTSTGSNTQYLIFASNNEFGNVSNGQVTALCLYKNSGTYAAYVPHSKATRLMWGGYMTDVNSNRITVLGTIVDEHENRGYWITPKLESQNIIDKFNHLVKKFKPMVHDEDKIIVKYRTKDNTLPDYRTLDFDNNSSISEVWVDGNTYTSTQDLSMISAGDEVEIVGAQGSGYCAHITSITENAGTYTVNLDETIPSVTAGEKLKAIYSNWTKLGEITNSDILNEDGYKKFPIDKNAKWIQFKFELRGFDIKDEDTIIDNQKHE